MAIIFAKRLKELRKKCNLTQNALADMLFVDQSAISYWEQNKTKPDFEKQQLLATMFDVSIDYLLGRTDVKKTSPTSEDIELDELLQELPNKAFIKKFDLLTQEQKDMIIAQMEVLIKNHQSKP